MPEILDWHHLSQQHRFVVEGDSKHCMTCGNTADNHWFPRKNPQPLIDEISDIVNEAFNRNLLE